MAEPDSSVSRSDTAITDPANTDPANTGSVKTEPTRYRCTACGNLTRFDVTISRRTKAFHHFTVGGELEIEDVEVIEETVEEVSCRWCSSSRSVVVLDESI